MSLYGSTLGAAHNMVVDTEKEHHGSESSYHNIGEEISKNPPSSLHKSDKGSTRSVTREELLGSVQQEKIKGNATLLSCVVNLANTIVGAGMLGLPGAFGGTGYVGGSILIFLSACFSAHGLVLLSKAAQQAGLPSSFYSVARAAVPQYTILIDLAVALKCFGVATGYLLTVGDCMVDALDHLLLNGDPDHDDALWIQIVLSRQFWVMGAVLAVLPVSFYRTLDELKKASAVALIFVFFLAFGIIAYAYGLADPCLGQEDVDCRGEIEAFTNVPRTVSKLPIFVFAFTCHQNIFPIVNEIHHRSQQRLNQVIACAIGFAFLLFFTVALCGYSTFGANVRGDILLNYPETGNVTALRMCIAFMLALHYPLQLDPSRRCISSVIAVVQEWLYREGGDDEPHRHYHRQITGLWRPTGVYVTEAGEIIERDQTKVHPAAALVADQEPQQLQQQQQQQEISPVGDDRQFYIVTISFLFLSFLVAMVVDDLGVVLAMVGATGSTLVSYVLPGLIYLKIHLHDDWSRVGAKVQLGLGCLIMPVALYFVLTER